MTIEFFVPGKPATAGSKRTFMPKGATVPNVVDDCERGRSWRQDVRLAVGPYAAGPLIDAPIALEVTFKFQRPRKHFYSGRRSSVLRDDAPVVHTGKPDATKLVRAVEDALNGYLWTDDSRIFDQHVRKIWSDKPGALVRIDYGDAAGGERC